MKIYISGKISGTTDYKERFEKARQQIIQKGHEAVNPCDLDAILNPLTTTWEQYVTADLGLLRACDGVLFLADWGNSNGARIEHREAVRIQKKIFYKIDDIEPNN